MSEPEPEAEPASDAVDGEIPAPAKKPRFSKKVLIIAGVVLLLLLVGGGAAYFLMRSSGKPDEHAATADTHSEEAETYVDAPPMVINLRGADGSARFLKIHFTLVPASAAAGEKVKAKLPLIVDSFQSFLRELRPEDLAGSAAVFRIKEEMLVRASGAMGPHMVNDVLIQDLIQQ